MKNSTSILINYNLNIEVKSPKLKDVIEAFKKAIQPCFQYFVTQVLYYYAENYMKTGELAKRFGCNKVVWKNKKGNKMTKILTIFGNISLPQIQIKNPENSKRYIITRILLGIRARIRIPDITIKAIGLMGSLAVTSNDI